MVEQAPFPGLAKGCRPARAPRGGAGGRREVENERHRREDDERGEHEVHLHPRIGVQHEIAEARRRSDPLAHHGADGRNRRGDPQAGGAGRQGRGNAQMDKLAPARGAHAAREVQPAGIGAGKAVIEGGRHRKENDEHRHRHLGGHAVAEPEHQHRRDGEHRDGLTRDQDGQQPEPRRAHMGDHQRRKRAERRAEDEAEQDFRQRRAGMGQEKPRMTGQRRRHGRRSRKDEGLRPGDGNDRLPDDQQPRRHESHAQGRLHAASLASRSPCAARTAGSRTSRGGARSGAGTASSAAGRPVRT